MPKLSDRQFLLEGLVTGYCLALSAEMEEVDFDINCSSVVGSGPSLTDPDSNYSQDSNDSMSGSDDDDDDDGDEHDELDCLISSGLDTDMETAFSVYDLDKSSDAESIQSGDSDKSSGSLSDCSCDFR
ncbi:hypothetical protein V1527DRAFT_451276 [Lipomyces starkeyi]